MSDASTLPGVTLASVSIGAAWNVQGRRAVDAAQRHFGMRLDATAGAVTHAADITAMWLGPESWLLVGARALGNFAAARDAMQAGGGALFDVSASRVAYAVSGARALDVLAAGCPLDLHADAFPPGRCAQSLFGRTSALYCRARGGVVLMVPRSFARDVWHGLVEAAREYGYVEAPARAWQAPHGF